MSEPSSSSVSAPDTDAPSHALAVARRSVREYARTHPGVVAAFVCGSTAQGHGCRYRDVDLRVVLDDGPRFAPRRGAYELVDGVLLDWSFQHRSEYDDLAGLLRNSWLCPNVVEALVVHDPLGFMEPVCAAVRAHYRDPANVRARTAERFAKLVHFQREAEREAAQGDYFGLIAAALVLPKCTTSVPAVLTCRAPTTRRRMFVLRDSLAELGRPELWADMEEFYSFARVRAGDVRRGLEDALRLYDRANAVADAALARYPEMVGIRSVIDPLKRDYWAQGLAEMLDAGHTLEALSPIVHIGLIATMVLAASGAPGSSLVESAGDTELLRRLGFLGTRTLLAKARALDPFRLALLSIAEERLGSLAEELSA